MSYLGWLVVPAGGMRNPGITACNDADVKDQQENTIKTLVGIMFIVMSCLLWTVEQAAVQVLPLNVVQIMLGQCIAQLLLSLLFCFVVLLLRSCRRQSEKFRISYLTTELQMCQK